MTKNEGGLVVIIFFLVFVISGLCCLAWQQKKNEELMYCRLSELIEMQNEHIAKLEYKQSLMQSDLARTGIYDKE